jgi:hypothetical protein
MVFELKSYSITLEDRDRTLMIDVPPDICRQNLGWGNVAERVEAG